ncbi:MAG: ATP-binding protein [Acholeplasmataceae bacterium]|nr:ATP-binding protein [Acholeplasmataceae bacterium]
MLVGFNMRNFKSFGKEEAFNMIASQTKRHATHVYNAPKHNVLKFSALFGANASGKSNFVKGIQLFKNLALRGEVFFYPEDLTFKLQDLSKDIDFEMEFLIEDIIYVYGISANFHKRIISKEYLLQIKNNSEKTLFVIDNLKKDFEHVKLDVKNQDRLNIYKDDLKEHQLLLKKLASASGENLDKLFTCTKKVYSFIKDDLIVITPNMSYRDKINQFLKVDEELSAIDILKTFDTGITDYFYETLSIDDFKNKLKTKYFINDSMMGDLLEKITNIKNNETIETNLFGEFYRATLKDEKPFIQLLGFEHLNKEDVSFSLEEESDGTKRLIELINILHNAKSNDKTYVIDEIERSFHSNLTLEFIDKFLSYSKNNRSQLIITTHDTHVMNQNKFRIDSLWLIERDGSGMSRLIPLSDFDIRSDKVLDKDYLNGRYGGIPNIIKTIEVNSNTNE